MRCSDGAEGGGWVEEFRAALALIFLRGSYDLISNFFNSISNIVKPVLVIQPLTHFLK